MRFVCVPRRHFSARALALGFALVGLSACASEQDSIEKQLAKLHDDVTRLQAETDRMGERMDAMEVRTATPAPPAERVASAEPSTVVRPKLKIVRVEPDAEPSAADATDGALDAEAAPRVLIQGEGKTLESRTLPGTPKVAPKPAAPASKPASP
jgi:hypothetical protein